MKGATLMLIKRIFWTLLTAGVIISSITPAQAQSTGRKPWSRGGSVNNPIPAETYQAAKSAPDAEMQIESQGSKKNALVGSWLSPLGIGNRVVASFTSDGIAIGSGQGDVSLVPNLPTLTSQQGVWTYLGGRQFAFTLMAVQYDLPTGDYQGLIKIRGQVTLDEAGDQFSGSAKVEIFDAGGNLLDTLSFPIQATRIKVQPLN